MNELTINQEETFSAISKGIVEKEKARFDNILALHKKGVEKTKARIVSLRAKMSEAKNERILNHIKQQIADAKRTLRIQEGLVEFARIPNVEDVDYRANIFNWFPKKVREVVPDDLPLVFHGTGIIGEVRQIIKTNGLLTPEQRGESMTSFATEIDVGAKTNISVPCEFAEPNSRYWIPYGAIFAFLPRPEEVDKVNRTGDSTEVFGGVSGVNFKQEPERLFGIITSPENIKRVQTWCEEYGLDGSKVMTHNDFIESFKGK